MISRRSAIIVALVAICLVGNLAFIAHQSPLTQALSMLLLPVYLFCIVYSLIELFSGWRRYRLRSLIPLAACALAWFAREPAGSYLEAREFARDLPRFQAIIDGIPADSLPSNGDIKTIPVGEADKTRILVIFAHSDPQAGLIVEFGTGRGFPVMHTGYVYSSSGRFPGDERFHYRWPFADEIRPQWFRVSN